MQANVDSTPHLRRVGTVVTIASVAAVLYATLLPELGRPTAPHFCLVCGTTGGVDAILNVLLFSPLGVGLALRGVPGKRAVLSMCVLSILIETAQLLLIPGRDATLGDLVTNTLGGSLGLAATRHTRIWLRPAPGSAAILTLCWGALWLGIQVISSSAFSPSIPASQYYGQLAPVLGNFALFPGRVLAASIGDVTITDNAIADSRRVQRALVNGATVTATVVPGRATTDVAPILRLVDGHLSEVALVAQKNVDLLFAIRSSAATFRLRPPVFALPRVFPRRRTEPQANADTLIVSGQQLAGKVKISAQGMSETPQRLIPITASLGWTLVLPWQWVIEGTRAEFVVSITWMACLALPFGYWAACGDRLSLLTDAEGGLWKLAWPTSAAIIAAGLGLLPHAYGLSATPISHWLAALGGLALGAKLVPEIAPTRSHETPR